MLEKRERKGRAPDYKGKGIDIWINKDKNGNPYLSVKILESISVNCFKYEPKVVEEDQPPTL